MFFSDTFDPYIDLRACFIEFGVVVAVIVFNLKLIHDFILSLYVEHSYEVSC